MRPTSWPALISWLACLLWLGDEAAPVLLVPPAGLLPCLVLPGLLVVAWFALLPGAACIPYSQAQLTNGVAGQSLHALPTRA